MQTSHEQMLSHIYIYLEIIAFTIRVHTHANQLHKLCKIGRKTRVLDPKDPLLWLVSILKLHLS